MLQHHRVLLPILMMAPRAIFVAVEALQQVLFQDLTSLNDDAAVAFVAGNSVLPNFKLKEKHIF